MKQWNNDRVVKSLIYSIVFLSLCRAAATIISLLSTTCCLREWGSIALSSWAASVDPGARDPEARLTPPARRWVSRCGEVTLKLHPHLICSGRCLKFNLLLVFSLLLGDHGVYRWFEKCSIFDASQKHSSSSLGEGVWAEWIIPGKHLLIKHDSIQQLRGSEISSSTMIHNRTEVYTAPLSG